MTSRLGFGAGTWAVVRDFGCCMLLLAGGLATAQAQTVSGPVLFVESASPGVDSEFSTQLIAFLPEGWAATSFQVALEFDPAAVTFERIEATQALPQATAATDTPGRLVLSAEGPVGCPAGASCRVLSVRWRALRAGPSQIHVAEVSSRGEAGPLPALRGSDATILTSANAPSPAIRPAQPDTGLGVANAAVIALVALVVCGILASPFALFAGRFLRPHRETASVHESQFDSDQMARFVVRYLDNVQAAGAVNEPLREVDGMARAQALEGE